MNQHWLKKFINKPGPKKKKRTREQTLIARQKQRDKNRRYYEKNKEKLKARNLAAYHERKKTSPETPAERRERHDKSYARYKRFKALFWKAFKELDRTGKNTRVIVCPTCHRPLPRPPHPKVMLVARKYEVTLVTLSVLCVRLKKTKRQMLSWLKTGHLPMPQYKDPKTGAKLWTVDQMEVIEKVCKRFESKTPNFKLGATKAMHEALDALKPHGIDVLLYTEPGVHSPQLLRRKV